MEHAMDAGSMYRGFQGQNAQIREYALFEGCVKHIPEKKAMIVPKERTAVITPIIIPHIISYIPPFKKFGPQTLNPKPLALYNPFFSSPRNLATS